MPEDSGHFNVNTSNNWEQVLKPRHKFYTANKEELI